MIGRENEMPWDIPSELRRFKETTLGHPVIMGRKTFESIGHPLPGRKNIIITSQQGYAAAGCIVARDLQRAISACEDSDEVFICGGAAVYTEAMPIADRIYLTIIDEEFDGDAFFPEIPNDFQEIERKSYEDILPYDVVIYQRNK